MYTVRLDDALARAGVVARAHGINGVEVRHVTADTRNVQPDSLFVAMPSSSRDTHELLGQAHNGGAVAAIVRGPDGSARANSLGLASIELEDIGHAFNFALGRLCRELFADPSSAMKVVGITGTNGKTTTAWLVRHALQALGERAAYLGTLGFGIGAELRTLENTTPFPVETWALLTEARAGGATHLVMEASSHALEGRRLSGVSFDVGCLTNFTQDHLDYHGTMAAYEAAKKLLFTEVAALSRKPFIGALNTADPVGARWQDELPVPVVRYAGKGATLEVGSAQVHVDRVDFELLDGVQVSMRLGGRYNVENGLSALACLVALGIPVGEAAHALRDAPAVPGRFEAVPNAHGFGVLIDYAHTPDALTSVLRCVRELGPSRVITVFGCGGDRDRSKRPKMAAAASGLSDVAILTSDNPRTEDPVAIIAEVAKGLDASADSLQIVERPEAIAAAIGMARPGDVVVIAGKGHEDYQIIGRTKHPMSDRLLAQGALEAVR